ncbi:flavodoxin family protein [Fusibacter bizertensis]
MSKNVIIFYSKDNNTRTGAKLVAEKIEARIVELIEVKKGNFIQALVKKGSKLQGNPWSEIKDAEAVFLMFPIWASNGVPAMNAFLDRADFHDKIVTIITFQQFEDLRNSDKVHAYVQKKVEEKGGKVICKKALVGGKMNHYAGEAALKMEVDKIKFT